MKTRWRLFAVGVLALFPLANVSGQTDANGKKFHDLMLETARTKGAGWVDYMFPRPGQTAPSHKWTYVKRVTIDGAPALLGAGFYPG